MVHSARRTTLRPIIPALLLLALVAAAHGQWIEDSIDVSHWIGTLAYNSREDVVYGAAHGGREFFAIACSSNRVVSRFGLTSPWYLDYDSIDNKAYCTFRPADVESLLVVDGTTHQRLRAVPLEWAAIPLWDPVANRLYVSCTEGNEVAVIDCRTDSVIAHIPTPEGPLRMHLNTRHRKLYVQCHDAGALAIVRLDSLQVTKVIPVPGSPEAGCYSEYADKYYCGGLEQVTVVGGANDSLLCRIALPAMTDVLAMTSVESAGLVMVTEYGNNTDTLFVIDARSDEIINSIRVGRNPRYLAWSPSSDLVYCAEAIGQGLSVIAGDGHALVKRLTVGAGPFVVLPTAGHSRAYVSHTSCSMVYVIRDEVGIAEEPPAVAGLAHPAATVVSDRYELKGGGHARLVDITGRQVAELAPGPNDVRRLAPGIYAVVAFDGRHCGKVLKVR